MKNAYGQGSGVVWLDYVRCNGTETDISQCLHNGWGVYDCSRYEAVSIACNPTTPEQGPLSIYHRASVSMTHDIDTAFLSVRLSARHVVVFV